MRKSKKNFINMLLVFLMTGCDVNIYFMTPGLSDSTTSNEKISNVSSLKVSSSSSSASTKNEDESTSDSMLKVKEIEVVGKYKTEYYVGETLDLTGVQLLVTYTDNSKTTIFVTKSMITPVDMTTVGMKTIIVSYEGLTTQFYISVIEQRVEKVDPEVTISVYNGATLVIGFDEAPTVTVPEGVNYTTYYEVDEVKVSDTLPTTPGTYSFIVETEENDQYNAYRTYRVIYLVDAASSDFIPVIDGSLDEWRGTKNEENRLAVIGTEEFTGKGVTFYASLRCNGLYLAAEVNHKKYIDNDPTWWCNSNLEFFIAGNHQGYIAANGSKQLATDYEWTITGDAENGYHSIVEGFIPTENLPAGAVVAGEIRVGWAWKTNGDPCNNGEANGGGADPYWVPKGTWTNNADQSYVTKDGIFRKSQVNFELADFKTVTLDGNLNDWEGINGVTLTGTGDYSYKDVTWYARRTSEGLFVAAKAHHDVYINNDETWWKNTNLEFYVNGYNQKYISANGNAAGGVYGTHTSRELDGDGALYETTFEAVIPNAYLEAILDADGNVAVGFAWKTPGDTITGGGDPIGASEWWILASHDRYKEQFIVTEEGLVDPKA